MALAGEYERLLLQRSVTTLPQPAPVVLPPTPAEDPLAGQIEAGEGAASNPGVWIFVTFLILLVLAGALFVWVRRRQPEQP